MPNYTEMSSTLFYNQISQRFHIETMLYGQNNKVAATSPVSHT